MTAALWRHARRIAEPLAASLAALEFRSSGPNADGGPIRDAIRGTWEQVVDDAERGRAGLGSRYLAGVHKRLATAAGAEMPGRWTDRGPPALTSGRLPTWREFVATCADGLGGYEESWVLAGLRWGGHVRSLPLSLGWIALNLARFADGRWAVHPPADDHEWFVRVLAYAGPDDWDAESLRARIGEYAKAQDPSRRSDGRRKPPAPSGKSAAAQKGRAGRRTARKTSG